MTNPDKTDNDPFNDSVKSFLREAVKTPSGIDFFLWLRVLAGLENPAMPERSEQLNYDAGRRFVGQQVMELLKETNPEAYAKLHITLPTGVTKGSNDENAA